MEYKVNWTDSDGFTHTTKFRTTSAMQNFVSVLFERKAHYSVFRSTHWGLLWSQIADFRLLEKGWPDLEKTT